MTRGKEPARGVDDWLARKGRSAKRAQCHMPFVKLKHSCAMHGGLAIARPFRPPCLWQHRHAAAAVGLDAAQRRLLQRLKVILPACTTAVEGGP